MMQVHKTIATGLGIGYIGKGGGTIAAAVCCGGWFVAQAGGYGNTALLIAAILMTVIGVWSATVVEKEWGKDSSKVVIDEFAGMSVSLLWLPIHFKYVIAAFILFRFFDIVKPLFIRKMEDLKGGWGVMMDDILAGIYTNIVLQFCVYFNLF